MFVLYFVNLRNYKDSIRQMSLILFQKKIGGHISFLWGHWHTCFGQLSRVPKSGGIPFCQPLDRKHYSQAFCSMINEFEGKNRRHYFFKHWWDSNPCHSLWQKGTLTIWATVAQLNVIHLWNSFMLTGVTHMDTWRNSQEEFPWSWGRPNILLCDLNVRKFLGYTDC